MAVLKIVPNIAAGDTAKATSFYKELLGLDVAMDMGWIVTYAANNVSSTQISIASEGGSGTVVPDISIEVDNVDDLHVRAQQSEFDIVYEITDEPWGVRRFYVRDPLGKVVNILQHVAE